MLSIEGNTVGQVQAIVRNHRQKPPTFFMKQQLTESTSEVNTNTFFPIYHTSNISMTNEKETLKQRQRHYTKRYNIDVQSAAT